MTALLVIFAFSFVAGALWIGAYWIDRLYWRLDNRRRSGDGVWRKWWVG